MALSQRLDVRQSQQLVMTPQLQQAIKLLQMSNIELSAFVAEELERNPLLEKEKKEEERFSSEPEAAEEASQEKLEKIDRSLQDVSELAQSDKGVGLEDSPLDTSYDNVFTGQSQSEMEASSPSLGSYKEQGGSHDFSSFDPFENLADGGQTLREFLIEQISLEPMNAQERMLVLALVDELDSNGYLLAELTDFAQRLGCTDEVAQDALDILQSLEPTGVGARSLAECLRLQLHEANLMDAAYDVLLENLQLLGAHRYESLCRLMGVSSEELGQRLLEIKALDPKPGLRFDPDIIADAIVPDLLMRAGPNQSWLVELNPDSLPSVLVSQSYYQQVSAGSVSSEDKAYLAEQLQSANWLVKALHQRATTILRVASEIVRRQDMFFRHGIKHLKPMTLKDIAETLELHESTVSRVTANKFMTTQRGVFELKYFFTTALPAAGGGEGHSAEAIKYQIKQLIDAEDPKKILSDDKLVDLLKSDGIEIARRTVAKYRESLNIPSSVQRRREKKNAAFL